MRSRIQIIDDNVALTTLLAKALTKFDYDPIVENNPLLAIAADWRLDETMTGFDAELLIYAQNGNRIAVLKRNGPDYYSGQFSTGQAITLWRE